MVQSFRCVSHRGLCVMLCHVMFYQNVMWLQADLKPREESLWVISLLHMYMCLLILPLQNRTVQ